MMTPIWIYATALVFGYLIGSISFARLVFSKLRPGEKPDTIRTPTIDGQAELVSHAVGATNVMMAFGSRWGMLVTFLDALKAFAPTLILRIIYPEEPYFLVVAVAVLIGHLWPVWYRFSGGGGNSSIMGMLLAISPLGLLVTHAGGMLIGRIAPMFAFLSGVALTIPWFVFLDGIYSPEVVFAILITSLYLLAELPEIRQVLKLKKQGHKMDYGHVLSMMKKNTSKKKDIRVADKKYSESKEERE
jgi:acyl phosphate:glycerol-3-phosphate acyltransferase